MGNSQFNFSMPPENHYYVPARSNRKPVHGKSRSNTVAVAVVSMLGGMLVTAGVAFALLPAVAGTNVAEAFGAVPSTSSSQVNAKEKQVSSPEPAVKAVPAVATGDQVKGTKAALASEAKSAYPVHRQQAAVAVVEDREADEADDLSVDAVAQPAAERTWVDGWTEEIVHPAVYDDIPNYESYICVECGYESLDLSDIVAHIDGHGSGDYLTVDNDCPKVVLEEEWIEKIEHEGHWE